MYNLYIYITYIYVYIYITYIYISDAAKAKFVRLVGVLVYLWTCGDLGSFVEANVKRFWNESVTMFSDPSQASARTWLLKSLVDLLEAE